MNVKLTFIAMAASSVLLGACATAPKPLQGAFTPVTPREAVAGSQVGTSVRWGGRIVETRPGQDNTCFQLISRPLGGTGRPLSSAPDATDGRFIACRAGFYDPAVFEAGRDVTFIGKIDGYANTRIGDYDYRLPKLSADVIYLWPEQRQVDVVPYPYGPWGPGPYGPYWGGYRGWGWW